MELVEVLVAEVVEAIELIEVVGLVGLLVLVELLEVLVDEVGGWYSFAVQTFFRNVIGRRPYESLALLGNQSHLCRSWEMIV